MQLRLVIKKIIFNEIKEELSDIFMRLTYNDTIMNSDIYWKYKSSNDFNWKYIFDIKTSDIINIKIFDEDVINEELFLGEININISKYYNTLLQFEPNKVYVVKNNYKEKLDFKHDLINPPGLIYKSLKHDILKRGINSGVVHFEIYILEDIVANNYKCGKGWSKPNQYPKLEIENLIDNRNMKTGDKIHIINDRFNPVDNKRLDHYADAFKNIITNVDNKLPIAIGVYAQNGVGKSNFIKLIRHKMVNVENDRKYIQIEFNPWVFSGSDNLWAGLVATIIDCLDDNVGVFKMKLYRINKNVFNNKFDFIIPLIIILCLIIIIPILVIIDSTTNLNKNDVLSYVSGVLAIGLFPKIYQIIKIAFFSLSNRLKAANNDKLSLKLGMMNDVKVELNNIIIPYLNLNNIVLIMYVDDLDKCEISKIVESLNAIQLMLTNYGAPFFIIMSFDSQVITNAINLDYKLKWNLNYNINGYEKLDQIITLPFCLPNKNILTQYNLLSEITGEHKNKFLLSFTVSNINKFIVNKFKWRNLSKLIKDGMNEEAIDTFFEILVKNNNINKTDNLGEKCLRVNNFINNINKEHISVSVPKLKDIKLLGITKSVKNSNVLEKLLKIEKELVNNDIPLENLQDYFSRLSRMEEKLDNSCIVKYKDRITKSKNLIRSKFYYFKDTISTDFFGGYSSEEMDVFYNLSYYIGNNLNIRKTKKIINIYNLSRFILPITYYDQKPKIIQLIIMTEFWNYKMTWISLTLEQEIQQLNIDGKEPWDVLDDVYLIDFYNDVVITNITKNYYKHKQYESGDNPSNDFIKLCAREKIKLKEFNQLQQYIFNIDQCLKKIFIKNI
jgi:hypothetical protein